MLNLVLHLLKAINKLFLSPTKIVLLTFLILPYYYAGAAVCMFGAETGLNFGNYIPQFTEPLDSVGNITVQCSGLEATQTINFTLTLNQGNSSPLFNPRQMRNDVNNILYYNLYTEPARTLVWGDGTLGTSVISGTCNAEGCTPPLIPVYGRIPAGQTEIPVGEYTDNLLLTLDYS